MLDPDTIAAPITPPGPGPVAIVRISGPRTREFLSKLLVRPEACLQKPREAVFTGLVDLSGERLDDGLVLFFPRPASFTGEDTAEIQLHGSPFIVQRLMQNLTALGCRPARPGEFSERAFHNGKLDLIQAEAIADLIAAETEAQARLAREQLSGKLSSALARLGEPLRDLLAEVEAQIDFPEEELDGLQRSAWEKKLADSVVEFERYLDSFTSGRLTREGLLVVILGLPNAGKSSVLNRLAGEDRAIVTAVAGTTRDTIEEHLSLDGCLVRLCDTAGLQTEGGRVLELVERLGIERSWKIAEKADLVLFVIDPLAELSAQALLLEQIRNTALRVLPVVNKADLSFAPEPIAAAFRSDEKFLSISAQTGEGFGRLKAAIVDVVKHSGAGSGASALIASERHRDALGRGAQCAEAAVQAAASNEPPELIAFEIRAALSALEDIVGVTTSEDVLSRIFSRFCIGK